MLEPVEMAVGRNFKHDNVVDRASGKSLFYGCCVVVGVNDVKNRVGRNVGGFFCVECSETCHGSHDHTAVRSGGGRSVCHATLF